MTLENKFLQDKACTFFLSENLQILNRENT
jgi:hypothetical protein